MVSKGNMERPNSITALIAAAITQSPEIGFTVSDVKQEDMPLVYVNSGFEHVTGYAASEVLGRNCRFLQQENRDQPDIRRIRQAIENRQPVNAVLQNYRKSGEVFYNHLFLFPLNNEQNSADYYIGIQVDVSKTKHAEEMLRFANQLLETTVQQRTNEVQEFVQQLQQELLVQKGLETRLREMNTMLEDAVNERTMELRIALNKQEELNEVRSRFVMTVSHEFRTPLSGIALAAGLLKRFGDRFTSEDRDEQIDNIRTAVDNLTELLDQVIFISKSDANKLDFNPQRVYLYDFCSAIQRQIQLVDTKKHEFEMIAQPADLSAEVDEKLLRSVVTNLLTNATKYSPHNSTVYTSLIKDGDRVILTVRDEGMGIPPEDMDNLFEPFHRAHNAQQIQGTGLGLAIVKNAVERHRGTITVQSTLGVGTIFTVILPITQNGQIND